MAACATPPSRVSSLIKKARPSGYFTTKVNAARVRPEALFYFCFCNSLRCGTDVRLQVEDFK